MVYRAKVLNGVAVFQGEGPPEGAELRIEVVDTGPQTQGELTPLQQALLKFAGACPDLPEDAARNMDHYLYGHPKK